MELGLNNLSLSPYTPSKLLVRKICINLLQYPFGE